MKKVLLTAVIAATMSVPAFADISIKGDAHYRYSYVEAIGAKDGETTNKSGQRVRLHFTGKAGDTTVKFALRNDGGSRVSYFSNEGKEGSGGGSVAPGRGNFASTTGSGAGDGQDGNGFGVDYYFLTTKIGPLKIKAGDWWDTTGVGLVRKGQALAADSVEFSTSIAGVNVALRVQPDNNTVWYKGSGKINGFKVVLQSYSADASDTTKKISRGFTDVMVKGKVAGVGMAVELYFGESEDTNASVVHLWKTINGVTYHVARAAWDKGDNGWNNSKFSPLGVSILGSAPGINGKTALGNVNNNGASGAFAQGNYASSVVGVRADLKVAGMGVQVAAGTLDLGDNLKEETNTFKDIIITRSLGKGSSLKASYGTFAGASSLGAKISVKF